jgi:hypothetical protein
MCIKFSFYSVRDMMDGPASSTSLTSKQGIVKVLKTRSKVGKVGPVVSKIDRTCEKDIACLTRCSIPGSIMHWIFGKLGAIYLRPSNV